MSVVAGARPIVSPIDLTRRLRVAVPAMAKYAVLGFYSLVAILPIALIVVNSFKTRSAIFDTPLALPTAGTFSAEGYERVLGNDYTRWLVNSFIVTSASVMTVLLVGSLAAFALARYVFPGRRAINLYLVAGILLPTILGSVVTLRLLASMGLVNNLLSVILVSSAQAIPLSVFVLTQFVREVPSELLDAGRIDGANEFRLYRLVLPLIRPGLGAVAVLTIIPVWNDLWWPLILAPSRKTQTLILGTQQFAGQFLTDWNALLASLTLAMLPVLVLFAIFSRQLVRGLTAGAIK